MYHDHKLWFIYYSVSAINPILRESFYVKQFEQHIPVDVNLRWNFSPYCEIEICLFNFFSGYFSYSKWGKFLAAKHPKKFLASKNKKLINFLSFSDTIIWKCFLFPTSSLEPAMAGVCSIGQLEETEFARNNFLVIILMWIFMGVLGFEHTTSW